MHLKCDQVGATKTWPTGNDLSNALSFIWGVAHSEKCWLG